MIINPMIEELLLKHHPHLKQQSAYPPGKQPIKPQRKQMLQETQQLLNRPDSSGQTKLANKLVEGTATDEDLLPLSTYVVTTQFPYNPNVSPCYWEYSHDNYKHMHCYYDFAKTIIPALSRKDYFRYAQYLLNQELRFPKEAFRNHTIPTMFLLVEMELHIATLTASQITSGDIFPNSFLYFLNEIIFPALNSPTTSMTYDRKCQYVRDNLIKKIDARLQSLSNQPPHSELLITHMVSKEPYPLPNFDDPINQRPIFICKELADILQTPLNLNSQRPNVEKKDDITKPIARENALLPPTAQPAKQPSPQIGPIAKPIAIPVDSPIVSPVANSAETTTGANAVTSDSALITASSTSTIALPTRVNGRTSVSTTQQCTQLPVITQPQAPSSFGWWNFSLFNSEPAPPTGLPITISRPEPKYAASQIENDARLNNSLTKSALGPLSRFYGTEEISYEVNGAEYAKLPWLKTQECDLSACTSYQLSIQLIFNFNAIVDLLDNDEIRNSRAYIQLIKAAILFHKNIINKHEKLTEQNIQLATTMLGSLEKIEKFLPAQAPEINKFPPPPPQPIRPKSAPLENGDHGHHGSTDANSAQAKLPDKDHANGSSEDQDNSQSGLRLS